MILITGDSFAENYDNSKESWTYLLSEKDSVLNLAKAGCGQYKILKQLQTINLNKFDTIIISHTSYLRFHVEQNPYYNKGKYAYADLIYEDILNKPQSKTKEHLVFLFEKILDIEYQKFVYDSVCGEISNLCQSARCIHINFFAENHLLYKHFDNVLEMHEVWKKYPGLVNHLDAEGNRVVYEKIFSII